MLLKPCDVVLVSGAGWISRTIKWATTGPGEPMSEISHVGFVVKGGHLDYAKDVVRAGIPHDLENSWSALIQEAVFKVRRGTLPQFYAGKPDRVMVARPIALDEECRALILSRAAVSFGRGYAYGKILLQLLDSLLTKLFGREIYLVRRLGVTSIPICSYDVADCWSAAGLDWGCPPKSATPDDVYDFIVSRPDLYEIIRPLDVI